MCKMYKMYNMYKMLNDKSFQGKKVKIRINSISITKDKLVDRHGNRKKKNKLKS